MRDVTVRRCVGSVLTEATGRTACAAVYPPASCPLRVERAHAIRKTVAGRRRGRSNIGARWRQQGSFDPSLWIAVDALRHVPRYESSLVSWCMRGQGIVTRQGIDERMRGDVFVTGCGAGRGAGRGAGCGAGCGAGRGAGRGAECSSEAAGDSFGGGDGGSGGSGDAKRGTRISWIRTRGKRVKRFAGRCAGVARARSARAWTALTDRNAAVAGGCEDVAGGCEGARAGGCAGCAGARARGCASARLDHFGHGPLSLGCK